MKVLATEEYTDTIFTSTQKTEAEGSSQTFVTRHEKTTQPHNTEQNINVWIWSSIAPQSGHYVTVPQTRNLANCSTVQTVVLLYCGEWIISFRKSTLLPPSWSYYRFWNILSTDEMYRGILNSSATSFLFGNRCTRFDKTTHYSGLVRGQRVEEW